VTVAEAQSHFDAYARAFTAKDVGAIADGWSFPCLITQQTGDFLFNDRDAFVKNTKALQGFYDRQGVALASAKVNAVGAQYDGLASVDVQYTLSDASDEPIAAWETTYILRRDADGQWRARFAIADGEVNAWAARGTPLGGGKR
jgi:ketosteroid isomerase-like protein